MDYFTITLDVDSHESRPKITEIPFGLAKSSEQRFWRRFLKQAERDRESVVPNDINAIHAKIRRELPAELKKKLVEKLRILLNTPKTESNEEKSAAAATTKTVDAEDARRQEIQRTLETLDIHIKAIRGGSLEILLFVLGFAKLVSLTGISPDDFAKCLEIAAPVAMNVIFGTTVPLEADAKPSSDGLMGDAESAKEGAAMRLPGVQNASGTSYFIPALFGLAVFGSAIWVFWTMSSELSAERKELVGYVKTEAENIGKERAAIADKLSTLLSTHDATLAEERKGFIEKSTSLLAALAKSQVDKDNVAVGSQKALFQAELEFVRRIDGANQARETAVIEFVKSHLAPDTKPKPSPAPLSKGTVTSTCGQDTYAVRRRIQLALSERGLYAGAIDGRMGAKTEEGLRKFQVQASLPSTGTADSVTLEKLRVHCEAATGE
jgi:hypothetical protein